jgi:hypothetical protein
MNMTTIEQGEADAAVDKVFQRFLVTVAERQLTHTLTGIRIQVQKAA